MVTIIIIIIIIIIILIWFNYMSQYLCELTRFLLSLLCDPFKILSSPPPPQLKFSKCPFFL